MRSIVVSVSFFFFNNPATTEIYTLPLHDALPIWPRRRGARERGVRPPGRRRDGALEPPRGAARRRSADGPRGLRATRRSEEHTSELQSRQYLVCRLLLEKKKIQHIHTQLRYSAIA